MSDPEDHGHGVQFRSGDGLPGGELSGMPDDVLQGRLLLRQFVRGILQRMLAGARSFGERHLLERTCRVFRQPFVRDLRVYRRRELSNDLCGRR